MKYSIKGWGKGLNTDALASELEDGFCSDASNVRFRYGFAERIGGILSQGVSATGGANWLKVFQTPNSLTNSVWLFYANASTAGAWDLSTNNINTTPYTEGKVISSITHATTTATVTTATNHGRTTGDTISVWGASPDAYNGTFTITVTGVTTFTYTMASDPGANATSVGLYSYNGSRASFSNTISIPSPQTPTGGVLNGILILNSPADGLYYWAGNSSTPLRKVPGSYKARVSRPFGNYIVQIVPNIGGTEYTRRLAWSAAADPGSIPSSFTASNTNDAGDVDLADGGELVDCLPLGDDNIVYTNNGRWAMRYVGGNEVFAFTKLPGTDGLLYRGCVVDTPVGHVFLSRRREVMLHTGGACRSLSAGRVNSLLQDVGPNDGAVSFLVTHPLFNEVWVCFKTASNVSGLSCDRALVWNWVDDTWGIRKFSSSLNYLKAAASGVPGTHPFLESLFLVSASDDIGFQDGSDSDASGAIAAMIERKGMDVGDADIAKNLQRSRWNFDGATGNTFQIYHGSHSTADATPTYASPVTYTLGTTDYAGARAAGGKFLAVKVTWSNSAFPNGNTGLVQNVGRVRSCDLDITLGGKR